MRVAAVQASPVFLDRERTVEKARSLIREAARGGAELIAFGEGFLPGHPIWYHVLPPTDAHATRLASALVENAITVPGPETTELATEAGRAGATVVLGVVERPRQERAVVFDTVVVLGPDGDVVGSRRKLVPAVGERVIFTPGGGDGIRLFATSSVGPISALLGGENSNPLLTYAMRSLGARLHVAAWPPFFNTPGAMQRVMTITGSAIAYQNTAHVIAVAAATTKDSVRWIAQSDAHVDLLDTLASDGGSMVVAPGGKVVAGPLAGGDDILYADLEPSPRTWNQLVNRQYDRADVLRLFVQRKPLGQDVEFLDAAAATAPASTTEPEPSLVRRLIRDRFGDRLSAADIESLIPYVTDVMRSSAELETLDLSSGDPHDTTYADDPRLLEPGT